MYGKSLIGYENYVVMNVVLHPVDTNTSATAAMTWIGQGRLGWFRGVQHSIRLHKQSVR